VHARRKQSPEFQGVALVFSERCALVADRVVENFHTAVKFCRFLI
jgi:hypothetical protein